MADTNDLLNQLLQKMTELVGSGGSGSGSNTIGGVAPGNNQKAIADLRSEVEKLTKEIKNNTQTNFGNLTKSLIEGKNKIESATSTIKQLDESASRSTNAFEKSIYTQNRDVLARAEMFRTFSGETAGFIGKFGSILVTGGTKAIKDLTNSLQGGADGIQIGTNLLSTAVGATTSSMGAFGQATSSLGGALMLAKNGPVKAVGAALTGLGAVTGVATQAIGKLAEFGISVLSKEVEKTYRSFSSMSAAGAVFADGMGGMRRAAQESMLTVEQFSKVIDRNSELIAQSGLGMTQGAQQIGRIGGMIQKSGVAQQLLNLGYTFEEQASLTAATVANMRRAAGGTVADNVVAEQTAKYAENLRIIAGITGEDAKRKVEEARAANTELAFQQKIAAMSEEQRAQLDAAMATMTKQEQQNLRERMVFGTIINKEGAIMEATVSAFREKGQVLADLLSQNQLTAQNVANVTAQYGETIRKQVLDNTGLAVAAMAGADSVKGVAANMVESLNQANNITKQAVDATIKNLQDGKATSDELTKNITAAQVAAQQMSVQLQNLLDGPISKYSDVTKAMVENTQSLLESLGLLDAKLVNLSDPNVISSKTPQKK